MVMSSEMKSGLIDTVGGWVIKSMGIFNNDDILFLVVTFFTYLISFDFN